MNVVWIYIIALLAEIGFGIMTPTLPIYAKDLGGSVFLISAIVATSTVMRLVGEPYLGDLSDRKGRRLVLILEFCLMSLFPVLIIQNPYPLLLVVIAILQGLSSTIFGTVAAATADVAEDLDRAMGILMLVQGSGNSIGLIIGGFVADQFGFYSAFTLTSVLGILGLAIALAKTKDIQKSIQAGKQPYHHSFHTRAKQILENGQILVASILAAVIFFAEGLTWTFFPLLGKILQFSETQIGITLGVGGLFSTAIRLPTSYLATSANRIRLLFLAAFVEVVSIALIAFAPNYQTAIFAVALQGTGYGMFLILARTIAASVSSKLRGIGVGILNMFGLLGQTILVLTLGALAYLVTIQEIFLIGSLLILGGLAISVLEAKLKLKS